MLLMPLYKGQHPYSMPGASQGLGISMTDARGTVLPDPVPGQDT
jgi:hypothetical protein